MHRLRTNGRRMRSQKEHPRRYRRRLAHCDGWWLWKESQLSGEPERLLIAATRNHAEVETDGALAAVTGRDYPPASGEGFPDNYWEMTDCKTMGGYWMIEAAVDLTGLN